MTCLLEDDTWGWNEHEMCETGNDIEIKTYLWVW